MEELDFVDAPWRKVWMYGKSVFFCSFLFVPQTPEGATEREFYTKEMIADSFQGWKEILAKCNLNI